MTPLNHPSVTPLNHPSVIPLNHPSVTPLNHPSQAEHEARAAAECEARAAAEQATQLETFAAGDEPSAQPEARDAKAKDASRKAARASLDLMFERARPTTWHGRRQLKPRANHRLDNRYAAATNNASVTH